MHNDDITIKHLIGVCCVYCNNVIQDINDNGPIFEEPFYAITLPENSVPGITLTTVTATDRDIAQNGQIVYSIDAVNPLVRIDNVTGDIILTAVPDYEVIQALFVQVL